MASVAASAYVRTQIQKNAGRYIKDFRPEDLVVGVDGSLQLRNFELKLSEFDEMQLPISPKFIFVGSVNVTVPIARAFSEPIRVQVAEVFCLLTATRVPAEAEQVSVPRSRICSSREGGGPVKVRRRLSSVTAHSLHSPFSFLQARRGRDAIISLITRLFEKANMKKKEKPPDAGEKVLPSFVIGYGVAIARNFALDVRSIHIRFEDKLHGTPGVDETGYAAGITIDTLEVLPACDEVPDVTWRKRVQLKQLAVYCKEDVMYEVRRGDRALPVSCGV